LVSNTIIIDKDLDTVWGKIEGEFATTFKCPSNQLSGKEVKVQAKDYFGNPINIVQKVMKYEPQRSITVQSINGHDVVTSQYQAESTENGSTRVTLSVHGTNAKSTLKSWNYSLMSWPILRGGTKKRLKLQLTRLKSVIEGDE